MDPYNHNHDQEVPHACTIFHNELSFRIIYDLDTIVAQKAKVLESNPQSNKELIWKNLEYDVTGRWTNRVELKVTIPQHESRSHHARELEHQAVILVNNPLAEETYIAKIITKHFERD